MNFFSLWYALVIYYILHLKMEDFRSCGAKFGAEMTMSHYISATNTLSQLLMKTQYYFYDMLSMTL